MPPVSTGESYLPWKDLGEATRLLRYALPRQGFTHTYQSNRHGASAHSASTELTAKREDGSLVAVEEGGAPVTRFIDDPVGAARRIAARCRQQEPSHSPIDSASEFAV
ncbi:hypothetical protein SMD20_20150 [Nonomuraea sp. LP-02]|uniref:hypothetical protein n=1 Tax=Nonomuraea sp. LP-02 TaxID=3097960 RepID=UPI002E326A73|nr:hypothetical protein [Nonomuraea sp. LP-02]MED7926580.1 hypothetical protein [Nonomuraea sp. LP-02]